MNSQFGRRLASAAFIIGFFLLWEFLCAALNISDIIVPKPSQVFVTLWGANGGAVAHTIQTLYDGRRICFGMPSACSSAS